MSILRIVRMEFREEALEAFQAIFTESEDFIRNSPGCEYLQLYHDASNPNVRYTYSRWAHEEDLNTYRKSELFGKVWPRTKKLFAEKPQAYSLVLPGNKV